MRSILYWHPIIYNLLVKLMYKKHYNDRYREINRLIEADSSVVDVCCGDSYLYSFLKNKNINYLGLDFNPTFINVSVKKGINVRLFNIFKDEIPKADYVVIQTSLYQFIPNHDRILKKLLLATGKYLIITETVKSFGASNNKFISTIGKFLNNPGDGVKPERFSKSSFETAIEPFRKKIIDKYFICDGMDLLVIIEK